MNAVESADVKNKNSLRFYAGAHALGLLLFVASVGVGILQSFHSTGRLPSIESTFDDYIEELIGTQQHDRAVREIRMALNQYGSNRYLAHNNLGRVLAIQGGVMANQGKREQALERFQAAEVGFQQALTLKPDYPDAYNNLGTLYLNLGAVTRSQALFHRAVELAPDFAVAHHNLGRLYASQGDIQRALVHLEQASRLSPDSPELQRDLNVARQFQASNRTSQ